MRKIITTILAATALFACQKAEDVNAPVNDTVTFNITAQMPDTRTELMEKNGVYGAIWKAGDTFKVNEIYDASSRAYIAGSVEMDTPALTATLTCATKAAAKYEYILCAPTNSMNGVATFIAMVLNNEQSPAKITSFDGSSDMLISKVIERTSQPTADETLNFEISRVSAIGKVTIKGLALASGDKVTKVDFACSENISGKMTNFMVEDLRNGVYPLTFTNSSPVYKNVTVNLPEPQVGDFTYFMNVWPQTLKSGSSYIVTVTTEKDKYIKTATLASDLVFSMGDMTTFTVNMAGVAPESGGVVPEPEPEPEPETPMDPIEGTLLVGRLYWAPGNLQYEAGTTTEGFAAGWRLAPSQENIIDFDKIGVVEGRADQRVYTDYTRRDVFNFGGIENPWAYNDEYIANLPAGSDFSGKMYTDQACTAATTDFAAAKYGDIAYWASNGKWRMPTSAEIQQLVNKASSTIASYNGVNGIYFFNPAAGEQPSHSSISVTLTAEQMANGLFLPCVGRGYNTVTDAVKNPEWNVFKSNVQGVYRTATSYTFEGVNAGKYYGEYIYFTSDGKYYGSKLFDNDNKAFEAGARYAIRPVYVVK